MLFSRRPKALGPAGHHARPRPGEDDRGHRLRHRPDRPSDLEAAAGPDQLHRVRPLPGPVPGLGDRQAAVAEAGDHGPPRPAVRLRARAAGRGQGRRTDGRGATPPAEGVAAKPLVPDVIEDDVLWSCTTCGACVEQCPVDIEHVDTILDMRRYEVLMEARFPTEAGTMLRNIENQGDPWGLGASHRLDWTAGPRLRGPGRDRDHPRRGGVPVLGGLCRAPSTNGPGGPPRPSPGCSTRPAWPSPSSVRKESCTGDPARRLGNEYLYQTQAQTNIETLKGAGVKKVVASCPHCFNSIAREYPALGGDFEVLHHTQLLERLLAEGRLRPVSGGRPQGDLSRPVLPRAPQRGLRRAPRRARPRPRRGGHRDAPPSPDRLLLRRRRRPHVAGGAHRHSASTSTAPTRPSAPAPT